MAVSVRPDRASTYALLTHRRGHGGNIVSVPPRFTATTHTLLAHVLPRQGIDDAGSPTADDVASHRTAHRRATPGRCSLRERSATRPGNICDIEALAEVGARGTASRSSSTTRSRRLILMRPIELTAPTSWCNSLTKFLGGHGTTQSAEPSWIRGLVRRGPSACRAASPSLSEPDASYHGARLRRGGSGAAAFIGALPQRGTSCGRRARCCLPFSAFLLLQGIETVALRVERHRRQRAQAVARAPPLRMARVKPGSATPGFPDQPPSRPRAQVFRRGRVLPASSPSVSKGGARGRQARFYDALEARSSASST